MINPGRLKDKITIQRQVTPQDEYTQPLDDPWEDLYSNVFAEYIAQGGREFYIAQKINSETTAVFKIRYKPGINTTMRILFEGSRMFDILFIDDTNKRNGELSMLCREVD
jgi:SPP1 family predicted phage head-tail adaptor